MKYNLINNISGASVLITITLAFSLLFEPRYSKKTYLRSLLPFLTILFAVNFYAIFQMGFADYGRVTLLLATLPSLLYFFLVSLHRDGRFFFTFCLVDTSAIWMSLLSGMLDYFLHGEGLINALLRIGLAPVVLFCIDRWMRKPFLSLLHTVNRGWWLFSLLTGLVYLILIIICSVPTGLRQRPQDIPFALLMALFLPLVYAVIFYMLATQQKLNEKINSENTFFAQSSMISSRAEEIRSAEEKLKIERHDLRHRLNIIEELAIEGKQQQLLEYLGSVQQALDESKLPHYCANPILDAILISYFRKAENAGIQVEKHLQLPATPPVPEAELATVLANALENAIHACEKLPPDQREICITIIDKPSLMLEIRNRYQGKILFNQEGLPVRDTAEQGIGVRSIQAFCQKYNAACLHEARDGWFKLMIAI